MLVDIQLIRKKYSVLYEILIDFVRSMINVRSTCNLFDQSSFGKRRSRRSKS